MIRLFHHYIQFQSKGRCIGKKINRFSLFVILLSFSFLSAGCADIPRQTLADYVNNFNVAKTTTQDIMLSAKILAEKANDGSPAAQEKFEKRTAALDARLEAIDVISKYNDVLVNLASGTEPNAVKGNFEGFLQGLSSFGLDSLSNFSASAGPYGQAVATAVALIDDLIKKEKFKEAAHAAQRPILGLIDILKKDADSLQIIQSEEFKKHQDPIRNKVIDLRFQFQDVVNGFVMQKDIKQVIADFNKSLNSMQIDSKKKPLPITHDPGATTRSPKLEEIALIKLMVAQSAFQVSAYNRISQQIEAHGKAITEYKNTLEVTKTSFVKLNHAIQYNQRLAPMEIGDTVLKLRQAYLEFQEASGK